MLQDRIDCEDLGELKERLGRKRDREGDSLLITQPVLVKSLKDEFKLDEIKSHKIPAEAELALVKNNGNDYSRVRIKHTEGD